LTNALAGLFCASLNFVDSTRTISPALSFRPSGHHPQRIIPNLQLFHGALPHEPVCTENLTPFLKLLPCKGRAGISSLLDGHRLFDSQWQAMALDVRPFCEGDECYVEMVQNVDMVINIDRSMRSNGIVSIELQVDLDSPIPRPDPLDQLRCDQSKEYASPDVCFPVEHLSNSPFSIEEIFGRSISGACPVSQPGEVGQVHLKVFPDVEITPPPTISANDIAHYVLTGIGLMS
jgi:GPI-anchor transamidase subunit T